MSSVSLASFALLPGTSSAEPKPTIAEVKKQVEKLRHQAEKAAELSNEFHDKVDVSERRVEKLESDVRRQQKDVDRLLKNIGAYAAAEYRTGSTDATVQLLLSDDPDEFLAQMSSSRAYEGQQSDLLRHLQAERKTLAERKANLRDELARLKEAKRQADQRKKEAKAKFEKSEALLKKLTREERERLERLEEEREKDRASRNRRRTPSPAPPASGRGGIALRFAHQQLGEPYVFGAAGPNAWDCSGLTMMAWRQAGVSLPHSSRRQYAVSAKISRSQLQPGDLVIFYSDMHHVGLYAGNGMVLHAPRPGKSVEYIPMRYMPVTGTVRPG